MARDDGDSFQMAGSVLEDPDPAGPVAIVSSRVGGEGRVRSRFERLCAVENLTKEAEGRGRALEAEEGKKAQSAGGRGRTAAHST